MSALLDSLSYVADSLDKPGRAVRGLLAGRPREGLSWIPFSDAMGLTDQSEAVTGRQLLEQHGLAGENQEGFDWGDVAGLGAEMLLDPTAYVGAGMLKRFLPKTSIGMEPFLKADEGYFDIDRVAELARVKPKSIVSAGTGTDSLLAGDKIANSKPYRSSIGSLTDAEREAADAWQGSDYAAINQHLRGLSPGYTPPERILEMIDSLGAAVDKSRLPKNTMLYRGGMPEKLLPYSMDAAKDRIGNFVELPGFTATSLEPQTGYYRDYGITADIFAPAGYRAMNLDALLPNSPIRGPGMHEFLLPNKSQFEVLDVQQTSPEQINYLLKYLGAPAFLPRGSSW